jgi:hypothetical protein
MSELTELGDRRSIEDRNVRLVFQWTGDRWEHWLEDLNSDFEVGPRIIANTREGDPERDDPTRVVSPTYQQLQFQPEGSGWQALLVGQSGPHHFSAVFTFKEEIFGDTSIKIDVADRCRGPVESFASTYTVNARPSEIVEASPIRASWDIGPDRLTFVARPPAHVVVAEAGRLATSIQALAGVDPGSSTHRLLYDWHWC